MVFVKNKPFTQAAENVRQFTFKIQQRQMNSHRTRQTDFGIVHPTEKNAN